MHDKFNFCVIVYTGAKNEGNMLQVTIPPEKRQFEVSKMFVPYCNQHRFPKISVLHRPFDTWFEDVFESSFDYAFDVAFTQAVKKRSGNSIVKEHGEGSVVFFSTVHFLLKNHADAFSEQERYAFLVRDVERHVRQLWLVYQHGGWALQPKVLSKATEPGTVFVLRSQE